MSIYAIGTEVQEKTGRVRKKVEGSKWISRGRYSYMEATKESLDSDQRVFHKDGDRANDSPDNLVAIRFSGTRYELKHSRVIWFPKNSPRYK